MCPMHTGAPTMQREKVNDVLFVCFMNVWKPFKRGKDWVRLQLYVKLFFKTDSCLRTRTFRFRRLLLASRRLGCGWFCIIFSNCVFVLAMAKEVEQEGEEEVAWICGFLWATELCVDSWLKTQCTQLKQSLPSHCGLVLVKLKKYIYISRSPYQAKEITGMLGSVVSRLASPTAGCVRLRETFFWGWKQILTWIWEVPKTEWNIQKLPKKVKSETILPPKKIG